MSEVQVEEQQANPYNARKPWHEVEDTTSKQGANGLFYTDDEQATLDNEAPDNEAPK